MSPPPSNRRPRIAPARAARDAHRLPCLKSASRASSTPALELNITSLQLSSTLLIVILLQSSQLIRGLSIDFEALVLVFFSVSQYPIKTVAQLLEDQTAPSVLK
ncbi:hypothetical protein EMPG_10576 [Blastomyces silverae]|uniref:Uncharacterized protein n=1 Tax=Blastomyces silverae TaxID=2060906 RepID=A0A0H1B4G5_9EURO|nr:hypothetical protein EMPG_10576 [Blastomyces silverae]